MNLLPHKPKPSRVGEESDAEGNLKELQEFDSSLLEPNRWYTLNINPDDEHQYFKHPDRGQQFAKNMKQYMLKLKCSNKIALFLECSQPKLLTGHTRLHLHGVIRFSQIGLAKWYMHHRNLLIKFNHVAVNNIHNKQTWINYCKKDSYFMKKVFSPYYELPYPFYDSLESWKSFKDSTT